MFERFTHRARRVVVLAQEEARLLNHNYIGTEHVLLGLVREEEGVAAKALESLGISLEKVRRQVEVIVGRGATPPSGHIPFTPRGKRVLELSFREALQLGHDYIGTEHILLGLLREGEGVGAQALVGLGVDLGTARQKVVELLASEHPLRDAGDSEGVAVRASAQIGPLCVSCRSEVVSSAAYRVVEVRDEEGLEPRRLLFVFCRACGTAFGSHPL